MATGSDDPNVQERLLRLADVGHRAAELVHELRQPLLGIKGFAQLLQENPAMAPALASEIAKQAQVLETMLDRYRGYIRGGAEERGGRRVRAFEALAGALALLEKPLRSAGVRVESDVSKALPEAGIDAVGLQQVLTNLIGNALEAQRGRGGRIRIEGRQIGDSLELSVEDDGPGVPEDVRATMFDAFATTKPNGSGLGLYISREIARAAGGDLMLDDAPSGARFRIRIPVSEEAIRRPA